MPGLVTAASIQPTPPGEGQQTARAAGPELAMRTVEGLLGVPIQYYAQVDFPAFEEAIGAMERSVYLHPETIRSA
ncbi:MAG: LCP family protein [Ignavibacteriales bacterium]|nr:LCP family protein [Ignavibacteriales bacterium]